MYPNEREWEILPSWAFPMYMPLGFWGEGPGLLLKTFCLMSMAVFPFVLLPWKKGFWVNWSVNWFPALALVGCELSKWRSLVLLLQKALGFYFLFELAASGLSLYLTVWWKQWGAPCFLRPITSDGAGSLSHVGVMGHPGSYSGWVLWNTCLIGKLGENVAQLDLGRWWGDGSVSIVPAT